MGELECALVDCIWIKQQNSNLAESRTTSLNDTRQGKGWEMYEGRYPNSYIIYRHCKIPAADYPRSDTRIAAEAQYCPFEFDKGDRTPSAAGEQRPAGQ